jgi:hypothetical protein
MIHIQFIYPHLILSSEKLPSSNKNPLTTKAEATKAYQLFGSEIQKICQPRLQMHCTSLHIAESTHTTHLLNCVYNEEECLKNTTLKKVSCKRMITWTNNQGNEK